MKNELEYRITITVLCVKDNRLPPTQTEYFVTFRWKDESFRLQNIPSNHYGSADTIELVVDPMDHVESSIAFDVFSKTPTSYEYCGRSVVLIKEFMKWCKGKYRSRYFFLNDNVHSRERKKSGPAWVYASFICVASPIHGVIDLREIKKIGAVEIRCPPKKKYVKDKKISHIKRYINDVGFARMCNIVRSIAPLNCDALNDLKYTEVKRMRRALIIGITYENTKFQLESSKTDAKKIHEALIEVYKWPNTPDTMRILIENSPPHMYPSKDNISESLKWLVEGAKEGDALFLYFSGHGASADDNDGIEGDGRNEGFLPADHQDKGYTFDDFLHKIIVNPLPHLVRLTAIFDCCLSGTVLDLPFIYKKGKWEADVNPYLVISDIQLLSAAGDAQLAFENSEDGRFTNGILECIERNPDISFVELLEKSQGYLGENQTAQLTASQMFMQDRPFRFSNILSNQNSIIKQILWDVRDRGAPLTIDTHIDEDGGKDDLDDLFMFYYNDDMSDYSDYSV